MIGEVSMDNLIGRVSRILWSMTHRKRAEKQNPGIAAGVSHFIESVGL
ncbi:hypothetical protein [Bradyrhizobium sp. BR 1432]